MKSCTESRHPGDELLIAYLTAELEPSERDDIDIHLDTCDGCIGTLVAIQARVAAVGDQTLSVPASVLARTEAVAMGSQHRPRRLRSRVLGQTLKLPILVPLSLAAGALLVIGTQSLRGSRPQGVLTRAVPFRQTLPVTERDAPVRLRPNSEGAVMATLHRGEVVEIQDEERDWYRVVLRDGRTGWIERRAFE